MHYSERVLARVKGAEQATQSAKAHVLREHGVTPAQQSAMAVLSDHDGITAAELARRCAVTPQTMNSTLGRLEGRGLIQRRSHPMHGTLIEVRLTDQGRELFERADARVAELDATLSQGLTSAEVDQLTALLARVCENARRVIAPPDHP